MVSITRLLGALLLATQAYSFTTVNINDVQTPLSSSTALDSVSRRTALIASTASAALLPTVTYAQVFMDPAMYGDQELRVSAVDSVKEKVRRAILQKPTLAPSFFQLALLDALSYNVQTNANGPNGAVLKAVLAQKTNDPYLSNLQEAAASILEAVKFLSRKNAVTVADAIAIGGAEAVESVGGPVLVVQLGRADTPANAVSTVNLDLFRGDASARDLQQAFLKAGLTEREMTALLTALLTVSRVATTRSADGWKEAQRPKFREAGKLGRASEFKKLTDEDIAQAAIDAELAAELEDPDDGWYIADSFGTKDTRFGNRLGADEIDEKSFNKFIQVLDAAQKSRKIDSAVDTYGWIAQVLLDAQALPTVPTWIAKYAGSNLNYKKDLIASYNQVTQLGAVYTGGKYESLLKPGQKAKKSLNDDELKLF